MNITKDEARLLAIMLSEAKYDLNDGIEKIGENGMSALNDLEKRLTDCSNDKRRNGRTSQNSFGDLARRFIKRYNKMVDDGKLPF